MPGNAGRTTKIGDLSGMLGERGETARRRSRGRHRWLPCRCCARSRHGAATTPALRQITPALRPITPLLRPITPLLHPITPLLHPITPLLRPITLLSRPYRTSDRRRIDRCGTPALSTANTATLPLGSTLLI